jgi:hypothetical protein
LVPLRGVLENLGARVQFNAQTRGITIFQEGKQVLLSLGSRDATADFKAVTLSAAPQILGGSTYVPLRSLPSYSAIKFSGCPRRAPFRW